MLPTRLWNRTSDFDAIVSTTKWKSRTFPTDHNKQSGIHAACCRIIQWLLETCNRNSCACLQCDTDIKSQVPHTEGNVEQFKT